MADKQLSMPGLGEVTVKSRSPKQRGAAPLFPEQRFKELEDRMFSLEFKVMLLENELKQFKGD